MSLSLEQLKNAFKKPESEGSRPNNYYPFWNIEDGQQAVVRFLPDKSNTNPLGFLVEKLMHTLDINGEKKSTACLKMYGEDCPVCKVSSAYYKQEDKVNGKKYWRKKQHIAQALIIEDPLKADETTGETHQGKVRFLALGYQLFNVIKEAFESGDLDDVPYSVDGGYDFVIKKSKQGEYLTYGVGSRFRPKSRALTQAEKDVVEDQMIDLSTLLPANPGEDKVAGMLTAALNGTTYNGDESSSKPQGLKLAPKKSTPAKAEPEDDNIPMDEEVVVTPAKAEKQAPKVDEEFDAEAADILSSIRNRMKRKAE